MTLFKHQYISSRRERKYRKLERRLKICTEAVQHYRSRINKIMGKIERLYVQEDFNDECVFNELKQKVHDTSVRYRYKFSLAHDEYIMKIKYHTPKQCERLVRKRPIFFKHWTGRQVYTRQRTLMKRKDKPIVP